MKINTTHFYPPIPIRSWDWCATFDGYDADDIIGWGATEEEAKQDLLEQLAAEGAGVKL